MVATVRSAGGDAGRLADELFAVGQARPGQPGAARRALRPGPQPSTTRRACVSGLLAGKALPATVALVQQSLAGSHRTVAVALAAYQKVAAEVRGERVATVRVARPLADADRERLAGALCRASTAATIHLNVVVDPDVIGGIRVEIGDDVIDGTVASRLDDAGRKLAG